VRRDPRPYRTLIGTPRPRVGRPHPAGLAPRRASSPCRSGSPRIDENG